MSVSVCVGVSGCVSVCSAGARLPLVTLWLRLCVNCVAIAAAHAKRKGRATKKKEQRVVGKGGEDGGGLGAAVTLSGRPALSAGCV